MDDGMIPMIGPADPPHITHAAGSLVLQPLGGGGGGGSGYTLPVTLARSNAVVGYVVYDSGAALSAFLDAVAMKDSSGNPIIPLTTADFKEEYRANAHDQGYFDLYTYVESLDTAFQRALEALEIPSGAVRPRGKVVYCLSGMYAVRPIFVKRTGTGSAGSVFEGDSAVQYSLYALDFGTEAQLATWDGSRYLCDLDGDGSPLEEPVVKRLNFSACPSASGL